MIETSIRKDKIKNKLKVVESLIKNPLQTEKELKESTWLWAATVHRHKEELERKGVESKIMDRVLEMDDRIMDLANQITLQKIIDEAPKNEDGTINVKELSLVDVKMIWDYANNSTKRKAIFWKKDEGDKEVTFIIS